MINRHIANVGLSLIVAGIASAAQAPIAQPGPKPEAQWVKRLFEPDQRRVYRGNALETIGMPCGGIAAGQLYVRGDGTLAQWWIFNNAPNTGYGDKCYLTYRPASPVDQGFAIRVKPDNGDPIVRKLNRDDFDAIEFIGEYPIAEVRYRAAAKAALPVEVNATIYSPFIPLNARDSAIPATILQYAVRNTSQQAVDVSIAGWLQNGVCLDYAGTAEWKSRNRPVRQQSLAAVHMDLVKELPPAAQEPRRVIVFEDFENGTYEGWTKTGDAFADAPATGKSPTQQPVGGWRGKFFINTYRPDDRPQGTLTSQTFTIREKFIGFLVGGGSHAGKTCMHLLVDGKPVRTATGRDEELLRSAFWDVSDLVGKDAAFQIVDADSGPWGHINIDQIYFTNLKPDTLRVPPERSPGFGDMSLVALDANATLTPAWQSFDQFTKDLVDDGRLSNPQEVSHAIGAKRCSAVASSIRLAAGETRNLTFLVTWYFPNRVNVGNMYGNWFQSSIEVADYVMRHQDRLARDTKLFREVYYDTTLPHWLNTRLLMPVSILATETVQWWKNGRFYAWEGVGCCEGTCTHVWNYEHACARLFPELSRSTRLMQDLDVALDPNTGLVGFRGNRAYAADGQGGTVLKVYREHLMSPDGRFLDAAWFNTRLALGFLMAHDGNADGIIEDTQHNTFDINFEGPNTFVGSLYLAALRAGEEMAKLKGEADLARKYHEIFEKGRAFTDQKLFNGEYYIQIIPPGKPDRHQYGNGVLSDQVFGQGWAHQLGLGYIYSPANVRSALAAVYKHNWTSDVGPYNSVFPPQRWFARPGDAGLFTCTWPGGGRPGEPVLYRDEVWTGIEYQVAGHMLYEGMVPEALAIIRGIDDRYDGARHNPWNEVECGDHYARAMASWGCLTGIEGFVYDGPAGRIGFAPRLTPEKFKAFFTSAEGWGHLVQERQAKKQTNRFDVKWGKLQARTLIFEAPEGATKISARVAVAGAPAEVQVKQEGRSITLTAARPMAVQGGQSIEAVLSWE